MFNKFRSINSESSTLNSSKKTEEKSQKNTLKLKGKQKRSEGFNQVIAEAKETKRRRQTSNKSKELDQEPDDDVIDLDIFKRKK